MDVFAIQLSGFAPPTTSRLFVGTGRRTNVTPLIQTAHYYDQHGPSFSGTVCRLDGPGSLIVVRYLSSVSRIWLEGESASSRVRCSGITSTRCCPSRVPSRCCSRSRSITPVRDRRIVVGKVLMARTFESMSFPLGRRFDLALVVAVVCRLCVAVSGTRPRACACAGCGGDVRAAAPWIGGAGCVFPAAGVSDVLALYEARSTWLLSVYAEILLTFTNGEVSVGQTKVPSG